MKIYRVAHRDSGGEHEGYTYHRTKKLAEEALEKAIGCCEDAGGDFWDADTALEEITFKPTKDGIIRMLHQFGSHPDNG